MTKEITLFSRYKLMINSMWSNGQRTYTANELNTHVGAYENSTWWKRANNNTHYTTRTYQTALKDLGCITKIHRGQWKINGPIPEWFGSYHISALSSKCALAELEKSSFYWQSLKPEHKVNPWKTNQPTINNMDNNTHTKSTDCIMQTIAGIVVYSPFPQLTMSMQIVVSPATINSKTTVDLCDWEYFLDGKSIPTQTAEEILSAFTQNSKELRDAAFKIVEQEVIQSQPAQHENNKESTMVYTKEDLIQIIKAYNEYVIDEVQGHIQNNIVHINADDVVDLDLDNYNKSISVNLDTRVLSTSAIEDLDTLLHNNIEDFIADHRKLPITNSNGKTVYVW